MALKFIATGILLRVKGGGINTYTKTTGANQEVWSSLGEAGEGVCKISTQSGKRVVKKVFIQFYLRFALFQS